MHILAYMFIGVVLDAVFGVALDVVVWMLAIVAIIGSFLIALFGEDIGEPWASLLIWALVLACAILAGIG